jgi:hypothetical protein
MTLRDRTTWSVVITVSATLLVGGLALAGGQALGAESVWRSPFWYLGWALVAVSILFPIWKAWLDLWPRAALKKEREDHRLTKVRCDKQRDDLQQAVLEERYLRNKALSERALLERQRNEKADALKRERETHRQTKGQRDALSHELRYGIDPQAFTFEPLDDFALAVAHDALTTRRAPLHAAFEGARGLTASLLDDMAGGGERNQVIGRYFDEHRFQPTCRLFDRLIEHINTEPRIGERRVDYRAWLAHFYEAYNELRRTLRQMATFRGCSLVDYKGYRDWRSHDQAFIAGVGKIGVMHAIIQSIDRRRKYPIEMPD